MSFWDGWKCRTRKPDKKIVLVSGFWVRTLKRVPRSVGCKPRAISNLRAHKMSATTVIAIYFLIWWVTLFAVLPWGVRNQEESGEVTPGTDPGAPAIHRVWSKLGWTTLVATVIFAALYVIYISMGDWMGSVLLGKRQ